MERRKHPVVVFGAPKVGGGLIPTRHQYFVDTVNGANANDGVAPDAALQTMAEAFARVKSHDTIYFTGVVAEHLVAPLGVYGVSIVGMAGGRTRHDNGARWKEGAVAGNVALCTIREQGWGFYNFLMVPQTGYAAIRAWRAEDAVHPDSSHFIANRMKFIGNVAIGSAGGIGIEDWGGNHHYEVVDCEFHELVSAITATAGGPGIAAPLRNTIRGNIFEDNTNDITFDGNHCRVLDNHFLTPYNASTHPNTVNLAFASNVSGANRVTGNYFADAAADVVIAKGYKSSTGDVWRNHVANTAADIVTVPG